MDEQKYCKNCGAAISPRATFCAECGKTLIRSTSPPPPPPPPTSQPSPVPPRSTLVVRSTSPPPAPPPPTSQPSPVPPRSTLVVRSTSPSPPPPPPTSQGPSDYQRPSPPPKPQRRFEKRYVLYGIAVLFFLAFAAAVVASPQQPNANLGTPTPTVQASTATPNVQPATATGGKDITMYVEPGGQCPYCNADLQPGGLKDQLTAAGYNVIVNSNSQMAAYPTFVQSGSQTLVNPSSVSQFAPITTTTTPTTKMPTIKVPTTITPAPKTQTAKVSLPAGKPGSIYTLPANLTDSQTQGVVAAYEAAHPGKTVKACYGGACHIGNTSWAEASSWYSANQNKGLSTPQGLVARIQSFISRHI